MIIKEISMSRSYYLKTDYYVDFIGMQEDLEMLHHEYITTFKEIEPSAGERDVACFYIEGCIVVKIDSLCNYMDYALARQILTIERDFLKTQITDENDTVIVLEEYFSDDNIQRLLEDDSSTRFEMEK